MKLLSNNVSCLVIRYQEVLLHKMNLAHIVFLFSRWHGSSWVPVVLPPIGQLSKY